MLATDVPRLCPFLYVIYNLGLVTVCPLFTMNVCLFVDGLPDYYWTLSN